MTHSSSPATGDGATVITFGTFDLFHVGHLRILSRARQLGDRLVVGVSTDALNRRKKGVDPDIPQEARRAIVQSLECVDETFYEQSLELKRAYVERYGADVLVMGDDWRGRFDHLGDICEVRYLPRTEGVSTTDIRHAIVQQHLEQETRSHTE